MTPTPAPANRRLKAVAGGALAAVTMLLATACGSSASSPGSPSSTSSSAGALEKTSLTVGALAIADDAPLYLAIKDGYFKQEGLTVTAVPVAQSTEAIPDMLRGSVDIIAGANYVSFFQAESKGVLRFKVLVDATHCLPDTFEVMTLPGSGITGPAQLAGKTVAVNLTNNVQTLTLDTVLKADRINPATVHYVVVPFPDMLAALKAHRVDAVSVIEPYITAGRQTLGAVPVVSQCNGPTSDFPLSGYFATQAWTQKYPNTARAFQRAMEKAQELADDDPAAVRAILPTYTKITAKAAAALNLNIYPFTLQAVQLQPVETLMLSAGMLKSPLQVSSLIMP
jgi:NitT/TauT family transport system substrate-binding protein